jgi:hypothetical protein
MSKKAFGAVLRRIGKAKSGACKEIQMKIGSIALGVLVSAVLAASNAAANRVQVSPNTVVIMDRATAPVTIGAAGDTVLGKVHKFFCSSSVGCVVVTSASATEADPSSNYLCSLVDGVAGPPGCARNNEDNFVADQQKEVGQGSHTVETVARPKFNGGTIVGWQATYTIYELPPPAGTRR